MAENALTKNDTTPDDIVRPLSKTPGSVLNVKDANDHIKATCTTVKIAIHPSMCFFIAPTISLKGKQLVMAIPRVNHNCLNLRTAYEITNNIANDAMNINNQHAQEIGNDMTVFFMYWDKVSARTALKSLS